MHRAPLLLLCACACSPLHLDRPAPPPGALTEVFILGRLAEGPRAFHVADATSDRTFAPVPLEDATRFEIVYLGQPPSAYGWGVGEIFPSLAGAPVRNVIGEGVHYDLDGRREWLPRASWRNEVRLDALDPTWCLANAQCLDPRGDCGDCDIVAPSPAAEPEAVNVECPSGWFLAEDEGTSSCRPFEDDAPECPPETYLFSGHDGCQRIGPPCPTGDWSTSLPVDTIYVAPSGTPDAPGDRSAPQDLVTALRTAPEDATLALARGDYDLTTVTATRSLRIVGACESATHLIADLHLGGAVQLSDVAIDGTVSVASAAALRRASVRATGIALDVHGSLVVDLVAVRSEARAAVDVHRNGVFDADSLTVLAAGEVGVRAEGARVRLRRLLTFGRITGVAATNATVTLDDSAMLGARAGIYAYDSNVVAERIAMHDGLSLVSSLEGSVVDIRSAWTERTQGVELQAIGGTLSVHDFVSIGLVKDPETTSSFIQGDARSNLLAERVRIAHAERRVEIAVQNGLSLYDLEIVSPPLDDEALTIQKPTNAATLARVRIIGSPRALQINSGDIQLDDVTIIANDELCPDALGGLYVRSGQVSGTNLRIDVTGRPGLVVDPERQNPPTVQLSSVSVVRKRTTDDECNNGSAVQVFGSGVLELERFEIGFEEGVGASFFGPSSRLSQGTFTEGAIGVDIRNPEFSLSRVSQQVLYLTDVPYTLP